MLLLFVPYFVLLDFGPRKGIPEWAKIFGELFSC